MAIESVSDIQKGGVSAFGSGGAWTLVESDLGSTPRTSGSFVIAGLSGLIVGDSVLVAQVAAVYTGKGTVTDEFEMDAIAASGTVTSAATIKVHWTSVSPVMGNVKFRYLL